MAWTEVTAQRTARAKLYQQDQQYRFVAKQARLHRESVLDSGNFDVEIDFAPQRVINPQFDGWRVTAADYHYALGQPVGKDDGWVGFAGRQGSHWFQFRLQRVGYMHWPTRAWEDIGGPPNYDRANLTRTTRSITIGPNADTIRTETVATWANLWATPSAGSVSSRWLASGDKLKEEVILNQAGRDWIRTNRPPSTPNNETYFGYTFRVDWSDVPKVLKDGVVQDVSADWEAEVDDVELQDASGRLLALLPIDYAYVSDGADPAEYIAEQRLKKRFCLDGGNHYLIVGVRVDTLLGLPAGDLIFDPSVSETIGAGADDGYERQWQSNLLAANSWINYGNQNGSTQIFNGFFRFTTVNVPQGATIDSATIGLWGWSTATGTPGDISVTIYGDDADDSAAYSDSDRPSQRTLTSASHLITDQADYSASSTHSYDIQTIVQEIVNRGSWAANNDMSFPFLDTGTSSASYLQCWGYEGSTSKDAELDITYSTNGAAGNPWNVYAQQ